MPERLEFNMEFAKDNIFKVQYFGDVDKQPKSKETKFEKVKGLVKRHKVITTILISLAIFCSINIYMVYSFMKILQNI